MDMDMNNLSILDKVENNICIVENNIFGDPNVNPTFGEFSISKLKDKLSLIEAMEDLDKIQQNSVSYIRNKGYGSVLDNLGIGQSSGSLSKSLIEKKRFYFEVFDTMNENINNSKKILKKIEEEFPRNERIMQLFERCEKCDKEVENLRIFVQDFGNIVISEANEEKAEKKSVSPSSAPETSSGGTITIPSPVAGIVLRYAVQEGAEVKKAQTILILEAMKMEIEIKANAAGKVHFLTPTGTTLVAKQPIAEINNTGIFSTPSFPATAPVTLSGGGTLVVATLEEKAEQNQKREKENENEIRQEQIKEKSKRRVILILTITIIGIIIGMYIGGGRDMAVLGAILGAVVGCIFGYNFDNKIIGIAICGLFLGVIGYAIGLERNDFDEIIINIVGGGIYFGSCSLIIAIMKIPKPYN